MLTKAPKGTMDVLPDKSYMWQYIENEIRELARCYNIKEIRTPVFEHTELFARGVGDTTDVVEKEMYTFLDKGERSITLRPEGTAGAVRSYIEHSLYNEPQPIKTCYFVSCYRYEKPQAGRFREFHQFGVEYFGSQSAQIDAELISFPWNLYKKLGLKGLSLNINSIGCPTCRKEYNEKLRNYLKESYDNLCDTCKSRFERNPMRILDCKSEICSDIVKNAPHLLDSICTECSDHFEDLKKSLEALDIPYNVDPLIVRGLDYYTKTVFEITAQNKNSNGTICGGGRYDGLVEQLGGPKLPASGFALGLERLMLTLSEQEVDLGIDDNVDIYIGHIGEANEKEAQKLVNELRALGISADKDYLKRSVKAQMKYANKIGAKFTLILGDDEVTSKEVMLKNMEKHEEEKIELDAKKIANHIRGL